MKRRLRGYYFWKRSRCGNVQGTETHPFTVLFARKRKSRESACTAGRVLRQLEAAGRLSAMEQGQPWQRELRSI